MDSLLKMFVHIDDFWQKFRPSWYDHLLASGERRRIRGSQMSESEIMTIVILFHQAQYRNFKAFFLGYVSHYLKQDFPNLVSYKHFVALMKQIGVPLYFYLRACMGCCTGFSFVDSTSLRICHNRRIPRHHVFKDWAARGKTTMRWFYRFKLSLVINEQREPINFRITPGNTDDRQPVPGLVKKMFGKLFGDKGCLSTTLRDELCEQGIDLITAIWRNMKPQPPALQDKLLLPCHSIIETINDQLKNISQTDRSRHRSVDNLFVNLLAGLIAYYKREKKLSVQLVPKQYRALATLQ